MLLFHPSDKIHLALWPSCFYFLPFLPLPSFSALCLFPSPLLPLTEEKVIQGRCPSEMAYITQADIWIFSMFLHSKLQLCSAWVVTAPSSVSFWCESCQETVICSGPCKSYSWHALILSHWSTNHTHWPISYQRITTCVVWQLGELSHNIWLQWVTG